MLGTLAVVAAGVVAILLLSVVLVKRVDVTAGTVDLDIKELSVVLPARGASSVNNSGVTIGGKPTATEELVLSGWGRAVADILRSIGVSFTRPVEVVVRTSTYKKSFTQ